MGFVGFKMNMTLLLCNRFVMIPSLESREKSMLRIAKNDFKNIFLEDFLDSSNSGSMALIHKLWQNPENVLVKYR